MSIFNRTIFLGRILKARITGACIPLVVILHVTKRCNFNCIYCFGDYNLQQDSDFSKEYTFALIDDLAEMGTKWVTLGGGEPLLREDLDEIIDYLKARNIDCGINTNGTLIPQRIETVKKATSICISLDGDMTSNDLNRGKGTFQKIIEGIKCAKAHQINVHTNTVLTKNNIDSIDHIMEQAKEIGFMTEFNLPFFQGPKDDINDRLYPSNDECRRAWEKILAYIRKGYPVLFSAKAHEHALGWPDYRQRVFMEGAPNFKYIKCYAGRLMCLIESDGNVYPCTQLMGTFKPLNFLEHGFKSAWEHLKDHTCKSCYSTCFNQFNLIFGLDPVTIIDTTMKSIKEELII